jgi:hypothetical protein
MVDTVARAAEDDRVADPETAPGTRPRRLLLASVRCAIVSSQPTAVEDSGR